VIRSAPTDRERRAQKSRSPLSGFFVLVWAVFGQIALGILAHRLKWSDEAYFPIMAGSWWIYAAVAVTMTIVMLQRFLALRRESQKTAKHPLRPRGP